MSKPLSLQLQHNPNLYWPVCPVEVISIPNVVVDYSGQGMEYEIKKSQGSRESFLRFQEVGRSEQTMLDVFGKDSKKAGSLQALAKVNSEKERDIVQWVKTRGLLGFRPRGHEDENILFDYLGLRYYPSLMDIQGVKIFSGEPMKCFRMACQTAKDFWVLWEALKALYPLPPKQPNLAPIKKVLHFKEVDSGPVLMKQFKYPTKHFEVIIGEEVAALCSEIPKTVKRWRELATEVITHHYLDSFIKKEVTVRLRIQPQVKAFYNETRSPDFRPKPIWEVSTMLTAMYVRHFMAMREFRGCKMCGQDISHKRADADHCSENCRVKSWNRKQAKSKTP